MIINFSTNIFKLVSLLFWGLFWTLSVSAKKVSPSVIVASIEGEVNSLNMVDDFKVQMGPTSVGKKVTPKTILSTGKTGKVALLFSNGTLITIKPGSRFYLRTYKQLEGVVEGVSDPGKLEEEPTQSELSGHLDYGDLVVKAPKLKKGSSMKLTSPLGVAGIRGTMFQLMAVRNSTTGDIMGGVNLISGDIDFTDTGGNVVTLLSGQSIQLATSKLGEPVASMTGELVDLSSTYGPALTEGFSPPPPEAIFPSLSESTDSDDDSEDSESGEDSFDQSSGNVASAGGNFDFIHQMASEIFFEIEEAESSSSEFSFESLAMAPTVDVPTPEVQAPVVPASVTGETVAGGDIEYFQGGYPELQLLGGDDVSNPLVKIFNKGTRMEVEMRAPSEGINWRKIDPWVSATDFLGQDISNAVIINGAPKINVQNAEIGSYEVSYIVQDLRGLNAVIFRQVDVKATPPTIQILDTSPSFPWNEVDLDKDGLPFDSFYQWLAESVTVSDVRGNSIDTYSDSGKPNTFSIKGSFNLASIGTFNDLKIVAVDWRGIESESQIFSITISSPQDLPGLFTLPFFSSFLPLGAEEGVLEYGDPEEEFFNWLQSASAVDVQGNSLDVSYRVENSDINPLNLPNIWPGEGTEYTIVFEVQDPRLGDIEFDDALLSQLKITETRTIRVVATPPKLELIFHNPREELGVTDDYDEIFYLVRSKYNEDLFPDDGSFDISPDPGENNREDRKLYYKATAYDGFGEDLTNLVVVENVDNVDSGTINDDSSISISVDDQSIRGLPEGAQGATSTLSPKISIVDVLSPIIEVVDQDDPIEGIMSEILLLSGSSFTQVNGNSDDELYFPDAGLQILDNYYTADEIIDHEPNGIDIINEYVFDYKYDDEEKRFSNVWEFSNRSLNISAIGNYEINYALNDPSGNLSSTVTRQVEVEDTRAPVVKLYGLNPMYVDLEAILNEESRYSNPGAYAIENLFVDGTGLFDWDTEDEHLTWSVSYELCNDLESDTYDAPVISSEDQIATKIQGYIDDPSTAPVDVIRYRVTYSLTDKAGNVGEANRTVELRGSPNKFPHINFSFDQNGVPSSSNISGQIAFLTEATPWVVEVGEDQYDSVPDADVYNQLASGVTETIQYNTEIIFLDGNGNEQAQPSLANDLSNYLTKVNYWDPNGSDPQYVLFDENQNQYTKYSNTASDWRRVVIRYTSVENGFGNKSIRDLEVRLVDTTRPEISLSADALAVEAGEPFEDPEDFPNLNVTDLAGSSISVDREISLGSDVNATFDELAERGFWEIGTATITYSAEDEFGNEALEKVVTVTVNDTTAPHVALVRNGFGNSPINSFSVLDLNFSGSIPNGVDPYSIFQGSGGDTRINDKLNSLNYTSSAPYIDTNGNTDIILKASEYDSFQVTGSIPSSAEKITLADNNNRSYVWYSPFKIILSDGSEVQDPGILVYEASNQNLTFTPNVSSPEYFDNSNQQIRSVSVSVTVYQQNGYSTTSNERTYTFEDDIKPTIDPIADTDGLNTFVLVEAGTTYSDTNGTYFLWENGAKGSSVSSTVSVTDLADDELGRDINLQRRYFNESNVELNATDLTPGKPDYSLGAKYKIQYDATDSEGNDADSVYRWLIVQDTTAPDIDYTVPSSNIFEINSTSSVVNDENDTIEHILTSLSFTATDAYNFDQDLSVSSNKWEVTFDPPFQPDTIYPYDRSDSGYTVTVRVKDSSDNYSEPKEFELKIGDYNAPIITFIGEQEIHDFLRYGETNGSLANQNLFEDQPTSPDNPEYNATGFSGGAHRIIISDYSFVDPGVFAEDESFNISDNSYPLYPDLDGDNRGESYAIKRVTNEDDMENPAEAGIIYAYSHLNTMTLAAYQSAAVDGFPVTDPGPTDPNATVIPDFDGDSNNDLIDVHEVTIKYRVKDGWDNISDIKERRVYIYISKQYANSAFYATPLYTKDGQPFSDLYDANQTTFGQANPFLTSLQKDYDGDGVSDYWENIFGTRPDDANERPSNDDLANPAKYSALTEIPYIPPNNP